MSDADLPFSAAAERNREPLLAVLNEVLPVGATVLEIASGTGQHAAHFAAARPDWRWQPTDADPASVPGIAARCAGLPNARTPLVLDVMAASWPAALGRFDAVFCANMLHIAPWATCAALMQGAGRHIVEGGALVLYGPYLLDDESTAPSNLAFDAALRARDPRWGLRRLADVIDEASKCGIGFERRIAMPANNLTLVLRRGPG